jgi:hypothetical protein
MRLLYGGNQIADAGWVQSEWSSDLLRNRAGIGYALTRRVACPRLGLACNGPADADAKGAAVAAALSVQRANLVLQNDDGSSSFKSVLSAATFTGVRCVRGPVWSSLPGAQHVTWLEYAADFEWEEQFAGTGSLLLDYSERVTVEGGTPLTVVIETLNSAPVTQVTIPQQKYRVTQQGFAVGLNGYPTLAQPLYANPIRNPLTRTSPDRFGDNYRGYRADWTYFWEFASAPTGAAPRLWPLGS